MDHSLVASLLLEEEEKYEKMCRSIRTMCTKVAAVTGNDDAGK